jgi:protein involved in polysaccharide export with SLBB domain
VISEETRDAFYVIGDVRNAAAVQMPGPSYRKVYVSQAVAWAGGPLRTAKTSEGVLIRVRPDGVREEFKFDFNAVIQGKQADIEVRANDVLFIPGSTSKTLAYAIMGILPQTAIVQGVGQVR